MKTYLLIITLFATSLFSQEVIRNWNPDDELAFYQPINGFQRLAYSETFYLEKPLNLHKVTVKVASANPTGTASIYIVGHQAGEPAPNTFIQKQRALAAAENIEFQSNGQIVDIVLELENPLYFANNNFSIIISTDQGSTVATDQTKKEPYCFSESTSTGGFWANQNIYIANEETALWIGYKLLQQQGWVDFYQNSFAVDCEVTYPKETPGNYFQDVTADMGLPTNISNQGVAWEDLDNDGMQDVMIRGRLFMNKLPDDGFVEVTEEKGLEGARANAIFDIDNDGDKDIILFAVSSDNFTYLYENINGDFTKRKIELPDTYANSSFSVGDVNNDGYLDLFIGQLWRGYPFAQANFLLINNGDKTFRDETKQIYPSHSGYHNFPNADTLYRNTHSRGSQFIDYDLDGDLDLYITNYFLQTDEFYENTGDGWTNVIQSKGIDQNATGSNHGTGVDWYDYDNDGDPDLLLPQFAHPRFLQYDHRGTTIYKNNNGDFEDTFDGQNFVNTLGIEYEETHAGAAWGDANNDGLADFVISTFYPCRFIDFYEQQPDHTFDLKTWDYGLENIVTGVDASWVDFDNDGKLDLSFGENGQFRLFQNNHTNDYNFVEVNLLSDEINKNGIGSKVRVYSGTNVYTQELSNARGQNIQKPSTMHFGLATGEVDKIEVEWFGSYTETFQGTDLTNQIVTLKQGEGITSVEENSDDLISIFPNPVNRNFKVSGISNKTNNLEIFNINGAKIDNFEFNIASGEIEVELPELPIGKYYLKLSNNNKTLIKNFSIVK